MGHGNGVNVWEIWLAVCNFARLFVKLPRQRSGLAVFELSYHLLLPV